MTASLTEPSTQQRLNLDLSPSDPFDIVAILLQDQAELTAVEQFSRVHDDHAGTEPAQAKYYRSLMPATAPSIDQQYAFEVDLDTCSGCKSCVVACHSLNGLDENESWRRVGTITIGESSPQGPSPETIAIQHVTTACHHCADPGCLNGCPVKAYVKDQSTGLVRHLDDQCIGCKYCVMMCPYEVPQYNQRLGIVRKCDMCHQRLSVGEAPACVQSCPNEAIRIQVVDREDKLTHADERLTASAPLSSITRPTTRYQSSRDHLTGRPHDSAIDRVAENHWPLAALMIGTQFGVGLLLVERMLSLFGASPSDNFTLGAVTVAFVMAAIGLNLAPLHLGQPLRAWRVFLGLRTSWLSREAILLGKFMGLTAATLGCLWLPKLHPLLPGSLGIHLPSSVPAWIIESLLWSSLLVGLAGLFSSGMIYVATKRSLWCFRSTMTICAGTTLIGGLASAIAVMAFGIATGTNQSALSTIVLLSVLCVGWIAGKLAHEWATIWGTDRLTDSDHQRRRRKLIRTHLKPLQRLRIASALMAGACLVMLALAGVASGGSWMINGLAIVGLTATLLGETCERLIFFQSIVYDRMPGTLG